MINHVKRTILAISTIALLTPAAWADDYQQDTDKAVAIGMGSGVVLGAIVAGPAGAAIAGIFGAVVGDNTATNAQLNETKNDLADSQSTLAASQQQLLTMREALSELRQKARTTQVSLHSAPQQTVMAVESSVQFQTGSDTIEEQYEKQLSLIARALREHRNLHIRLTGHADNRGEAKFNQRLSESRVASVKQALLERGVKENQIATVAMGEKASHGESFEAAFFDRKVVMQVAAQDELVAAQR